MDTNDEIVKNQSALAQGSDKPAVPTWNDIGEGFEIMGKVGLAMAVGFSAAGLFCRLAETGKVRVPSLSSLVVNNPQGKPTPSNPEAG